MRIPVFLITFALLVITPHRLPAPIHEIPESPSPTPAVPPAAETNPPPSAPAVAPTAEPKKSLPKQKSKSSGAPRFAEPQSTMPAPQETKGTQAGQATSTPKGAVHLVIHTDSDTRKIFTYFQYPQVSAPAGTTGLYRLEVNPDGSVGAVTILKSMGSTMDVDLMRAFVRWRAVPGPVRIVDVPRRVFEFYRVKSGPR
jgi:outer membrane biosynthesis protein TonB